MHQRRAKSIILICFGIFVGGAADSLSLWRQRVIALDEAVTVQLLCRPYPAARLLCSAQEFTTNIDAYLARFAKEVSLDGAHCFVGRHTLSDGMQVHIIGDLHGSLHSLMRVLIDLAHAGVLQDDFTVTPGHRILFLGDMVDRGAYGVECLQLVLLLKLASWDKVMIVRGNHETLQISSRYGLSDEIYAKYHDAGNIYKKVISFFDALPLALFLGCQGSYMQCCHGGFEPRFDPADLLEAPCDCWAILSPHIDEINSGFNWSDFAQTGIGYWRSSRGAGWCISVDAVEKLINGGVAINFSNPAVSVQWQTKRLRGFIRGHQDQMCGCKLFCGSGLWTCLTADLQATLINSVPPVYSDGPFAWQSVLSVCNVAYDVIPFSCFDKYGLAPICTFSNATVSQGVPRATYATLQVFESFDAWTLQVRELDTPWTPLPPLPDHFPPVIYAPCAQMFLSANLLQFLEERGIQEELASSEPLPAPGDDVSNQPPTEFMIEQFAAMQLNGTGQLMSGITLGIEEYTGI